MEETTADTKLADEVGVTNASETVEELVTKDTASTVEIASSESSDGESSSAASTTSVATESMESGSEGTKPSDDVFDENYVYMPEYTYTTDNIFDGGIMFDWWKSDVTKGYASLINLGDKDLLTYVKSIPNLKYDTADSDQTWYMSNGVTVTDFIKQNSDLDYVNTLSSLITTYTDNINKYKALKKSYQTQLLPKLLYLTLTRDNASLNYTTNTDKNLLIEY